MDQLLIVNSVLVLINILIVFLCCKYLSKKKNLILLLSAILTLVIHFSPLLYFQIAEGSMMRFLQENAFILLPAFPCNVMMWFCLIFALLKDKESKFTKFCVDFIVWLGTVATLIGMFANIDFIANPTFKDFVVLKGVLSHAALLLNTMLIISYKYVKFDFISNMVNMILVVVMLYIIGGYCNLLIFSLSTQEFYYETNAMFMVHSAFEGIEILTYQIISSIALVIYFITFNIIDFIKNEKGNRWFNRIKKATKIT